jgi:hypothetical protein
MIETMRMAKVQSGGSATEKHDTLPYEPMEKEDGGLVGETGEGSNAQMRTLSA